MRKATLITGVAGTGKSTICKELKSLGMDAFDADYERGVAYWQNKITGENAKFPTYRRRNWSSKHHWLWDLNILQSDLWKNSGEVYVFGTSDNKQEAYYLFQKIFFLVTNPDMIERRLIARVDNNFGKQEQERNLVLADLPESIIEAKNNNFVTLDTSNSSPQVMAQKIIDLSRNDD